MSKVYLKYNKENNFTKLYFYSIAPLIIYSIYKNGFLLYAGNYISLTQIFIPLIFIFIPVGILLFLNYIKFKKIILFKEDFKWIFISLFLPIGTNIIIYASLIFGFILVDKLINTKFVNLSILFKLVLILILIYLNKYTYSNIAELNTSFNYNLWDILMGRGVGGVASTSYLYILITYVILSTNFYYKKTIPLITSLIFISTYFLLKGFFPSLITSLNISSILLAYVLLASDFKYSPYIFKAQILYSIVLAILTVVLTIYTNVHEGVFIAIFSLSLLHKYFDKILTRQKRTK